MCGFVGFLSKDFNADIAKNSLKKMNNKIAHRGPDGEVILYCLKRELL